MPYVQGVSEVLNRKIRKSGVTVHPKPVNTIRSMLGSPKDKQLTMDKTGTVYHYQCQDCPAQYIGETERSLATRVSKHRSRESSPVRAHKVDTKHDVAKEQFKILDTDQRHFQRGVKESIYISALKPDLNKDLGRHALPKTYKKLIESCDLSITSRSRDSVPGKTSTSQSHQC